MDDSANPVGGEQHPATQWRPILRALAEEVDSLAGPGDRDDMLRGVGRRLSRTMPLPAVQTLQALELEMNDVLHGAGWGVVQLRLSEADRSLHLVHTGFPRVGSLGSPPGQWLSALLEGLYDGWFAQQPGSRAALFTRRIDGAAGDVVTMSYTRR